MKFMAAWKIHEDKRHQVLEQFAQMSLEEYKTQHGPTIKFIGRWHDIPRLRGVLVFETDDTEALNLWILKWNSVCDIEVVPVVEDDEAHATMKKHFSGS